MFLATGAIAMHILVTRTHRDAVTLKNSVRLARTGR
jgi:hypothetical protein